MTRFALHHARARSVALRRLPHRTTLLRVTIGVLLVALPVNLMAWGDAGHT